MKIIADKNIPFLKGVAENFGTIEYIAGSDFTNERIKDADTLIVRTVTRFDEEMLKGTAVKLICSATIGYDHIDTEYCDMNKVAWTNAPGCNSSSVQQYVTSALLTIARKRGFHLKGKTIGVVGVGNVGKKVAKACQILGMKVLLNDPPRQAAEKSDEFVSLDTIKNEADIITFHAPLTKEGEYKTYHLADRAFFHSLKKEPIIINSARGSIVDTQAIKEALTAELISGAIIDCWENEPTIDVELLKMVDLGTPHIAGYSADGKANATRLSLESIAWFYKLDRSPIDQIAVPSPTQPVIDLDKYPALEGRMFNAILKTYNPMHDYSRLLVSPSTFKQQRNEYPLRREATAYSIINAKEEEERAVLTALGFQ